jgi:hypothetical protein
MIEIPIKNKFAVRWKCEQVQVFVNGLLRTPGDCYVIEDGCSVRFSHPRSDGETIIIHDHETGSRFIHTQKAWDDHYLIDTR